MFDITYTKAKLVTAHRKWYVATVCHDTEEGCTGSSLTGRRAYDFQIAPFVAGWRDTVLANNNSDRAVLHILANNNKGRESFARNVEILMTHLLMISCRYSSVHLHPNVMAQVEFSKKRGLA
jgi:hypothetical protein